MRIPSFFRNPKTLQLQLFENNVDEQQEGSLMTLLHYACQFGDKEEVEELLAAGANIFMKDSNGNLSLHYLVAVNDDVEILQLLFEKTANDEEKKLLITKKNDAGYRPFCCAVETDHFAIAEYLEMELKNIGTDFNDQFVELQAKYGIALQNKYKKARFCFYHKRYQPLTFCKLQ